MDLYILPMSCSFAAHVACLEAGIPFTLHRVGRADKRLEDGRDYRAMAPLGIVPAVSLPDGSLLTESAAVLQYIADQAPERRLAPAAGTVERYRLAEWLNFITTELHKKHTWSIFSTQIPDVMKEWSRRTVPALLDQVEKRLGEGDCAMGDTFTVADAYLFWVLYVLPHGGVSLERWPALVRYVERHTARASIAAALAYEGPRFLQERAAQAGGTAATAAAPA